MHRFFAAVVRYPLVILLSGLAVILLFGLQAFDLQKDTRAEVFIPGDHPAVANRERLIETFGLKEPVIVAIERSARGGIFHAETLALSHEITRRIGSVPGIDPERVTSLATEKSISAVELGLSVERFVTAPPASAKDVAEIKLAVEATPSILGRLVSPDHRVTLVVAELLDDADAEQVYWEVLRLVESIEPAEGVTLHVAGIGAMLGYLGIYMDRDAMSLAPIAGLLVIFSLFLAHRSAMGILVPALVIVGSISVTLGVIALADDRFYVITNALPVILIGIAVDDALHIFGEYKRRLTDGSEGRDRVIATMLTMARPVTVTTLTTAAGCLALGLSSAIPPVREFGLYAALGIAVAWFLSLVMVPAVLAIWAERQSPGKAHPSPTGKSAAGSIRNLLPATVFSAPRTIVAIAFVWLCVGLLASTTLTVDEAYVDNFQSKEPVVVADRLINDGGIGTNYVDIMIEGGQEDVLLRPQVMHYVEDLQRYAESLTGVLQSVSYLDSLKQIDGVLKEPGDENQAVLDSEERAAQYLLLYSMSGDPADFRSLLNNSYTSANLRLHLESGWFSDEIGVLDALESYIQQNAPPADIAVTLSGIAMVHVSWVGMLLDGHLTGVLASLLVVWLIAALSFRSVLRGSLVMIPVIFAVMTVYAAMALAGINLAVGTSMTAAIAIGLSVDFGVHLLHRIDEHCRSGLLTLKGALREAVDDSGRAIFFAFLTGFVGFGVLVLGEVPGIARFGGLVATALLASFLASLVLLPALILTISPLAAKLVSDGKRHRLSETPHNRNPGTEICPSAKSSTVSS